MLEKQTIDILHRDFPPEAVQEKKSFVDPVTQKQKFLKGYKPQYITERLNEAFGHDCWDWEILKHGMEKIEVKTKTIIEVWVLGRFSLNTFVKDEVSGRITKTLISFKDQFGTSNVNSGMDLGDAYKSASTDALGKCASWFDIGGKAYKGLEKRTPMSVDDIEPKNIEPESDIDAKKTELATLCKEYKIGKEAFKTLQMTVFKEVREISELTIEDVEKLIEHLKATKSPF
jgi:hypothetical protein